MQEGTGLAGTASKIRRELLKSLSRGLRIPPVGTRFENLKLKVPLVYGLGADHLSRTVRPWTYDLLSRLLHARSGTFVDIGANVGLYLIWLKSIDGNREYVGFEPNPACYFYLQELMRCNRFAGASVFPLALSDRRALATFHARRLGDKMGSLLADHRIETDKPYSFNVMTEPGDPVFSDLDLKAVSAIKIDVEGAEVEVLRGLAGTLAKHQPPVICEVLTPDPTRQDFARRMQKVDELLTVTRDLDYRIVSVDADRRPRTASTVEDLRVKAQADRILVPAGQLEDTLELVGQTGTGP